MPPRRDPGASAAEMNELLQTVQALNATVQSQQIRIDELSQASASVPVVRKTNPLQTLKSLPIPAYTGKAIDCSSSKVRGFICSVRRVARLSNTEDESRIVQLAICHFQDRASTWISRLEEKDDLPDTLRELQGAMIKEFVPSNERSKAQLSLMTLKMDGNIDAHIDKFTDLKEICDTPTKEAYLFFFMSMPHHLKGKLAADFPESNPKSMNDVYACARKHDIAEKWSNGTHEKSKKTSSTKKSTANYSQASAAEARVLDPKSDCWGHAQKGEGRTYRDNDRCCKCGKGPWSDPNHPCRPETLQAKNSKN